MALFGRYDPDFDDENMSERDLLKKEIRAEEEERNYQIIKDLKVENNKMKRFLKKKDLYSEYKRRMKWQKYHIKYLMK